MENWGKTAHNTDFDCASDVQAAGHTSFRYLEMDFHEVQLSDALSRITGSNKNSSLQKFVLLLCMQLD